MVSIFKEKPDGSYYCSECRMSFPEPLATCPYCGSWCSNYETLISRPNLDIDSEDYTISYLGESVLTSARVKEFLEGQNENNIC